MRFGRDRSNRRGVAESPGEVAYRSDTLGCLAATGARESFVEGEDGLIVLAALEEELGAQAGRARGMLRERKAPDRFVARFDARKGGVLERVPRRWIAVPEEGERGGVEVENARGELGRDVPVTSGSSLTMTRGSVDSSHRRTARRARACAAGRLVATAARSALVSTLQDEGSALGSSPTLHGIK